jgi:hypothetical protein
MYFSFDAVIVDTSALENYQFDFCGWTTKTLPSFFSFLKEQKIGLLNHPVLDGEIKKHILHSSLLERINGLQQSFRRNRDFYQLIDISSEDAIKRLERLDVENKLLSEYNAFFHDATMLPFPSPEMVFEKYFGSCAPFSDNGNKKSEFPDAFIIESVIDYLKQNSFANVLVISKDGDWKHAFEKVERASFCDSIDDALKMIQSTEKIETIVAACKKDIIEAICSQAENEYYNLPDYEIPTYEDVIVSRVEVEDIETIIPLRITASTVLFKCAAHIVVNGSTRIIDEDRSCWDHEEKAYLFISYSDISFEKGQADIECEITIDYALEGDCSAHVSDIRIVSKYAIDIDLDGAEISEYECSDDQLAHEALLEDHGIK